ncbi:MAG TPA: hypothetical protein VI861_03600 [Rickettsiales bacterium]|nr:hypothetical protein [Rickettsiales bacterium]
MRVLASATRRGLSEPNDIARQLMPSATTIDNFFGLMQRQLSTAARNNPPTPERLAQSEEKAREILQEFKEHRANHHSFFDYLRDQSYIGFNPRQLDIFRANFFFRTFKTIQSVANAMRAAAEAGDFSGVAGSAQNLSEEGGKGDPKKVHLKLLEDCFNEYCLKIFGLAPLLLKDCARSPLLTEEVIAFRKTQLQLFRSSYPTVVGDLLAHEGAADDMLGVFRETLFLPYKEYYDKESFKKLMLYFDEHRDDEKEGGNVEEQHEQAALAVATNVICLDPNKNFRLILTGGMKFLNAQANLWDSLLREFKLAKENGVIVPPKPHIIHSVQLPKSEVLQKADNRSVDGKR